MEERKGFGTTFGFLMAAVGSAVGLGNIWGFPNKMGANGGFTFLVTRFGHWAQFNTRGINYEEE